MNSNSAQHSTIILRRTYDAPVARVFAAISHPGERMRIHGGDQSSVVVEQADLRIGGRDVFMFGRSDNRRLRRESTFHDIEPERRIVVTDIVCDGDVRLWVAAATLEFTPLGETTQLKLTAQIVHLNDAKTADRPALGYETLLDNLARHLSGQWRSRPRPVTFG